MTIDIIDTDIFTALVTFLKTYLPSNMPVMQGIQNNVPMPNQAFVLMTSVGMDRISFNVDTYDTLGNKIILTPTKYKIQLDFYGTGSQSLAFQTASLFRDEYASTNFPGNIQPLFCDDPMQLPLINAESQYEQRWMVMANIQYNPLITTTQQSATLLNVTLAPIDQTFKP